MKLKKIFKVKNATQEHIIEFNMLMAEPREAVLINRDVEVLDLPADLESLVEKNMDLIMSLIDYRKSEVKK